MKVFCAAVVLSNLLAFHVMSRNLYANSIDQTDSITRKYNEHLQIGEKSRDKRSARTELQEKVNNALQKGLPRQNDGKGLSFKDSPWFTSKFSQLKRETEQQREGETRVMPPNCDNVCKYVGELLRKADFFAAAYCTFSTVTVRQGQSSEKEITRAAQDIADIALSRYNDNIIEIITEEPRIKIENQTEIKETCNRGEILPCSETERVQYEGMHVLKCTQPCNGSSQCVMLLNELFEIAEEEFFDKHDEIVDEEDRGDHDTDSGYYESGYPELP